MYERNYIETAEANEKVFRNILNDLVLNRDHRPLGNSIPADLSNNGSIEEIYRKNSSGERNDLFTILNFEVRDNTATLYFQEIDNSPNKGGIGFAVRYKTEKDGSVKFEMPVMDWTLKL